MNEVNPRDTLRYPLSVGDIVNLTFDSYKKNFILHWIPFLIMSTLIFYLSPIIVNLIIPDNISFNDLIDENTGELGPQFYSIFPLFIASLVALSIFEGALLSLPIAFSVLLSRGSFNNQNISINELLNELKPKIILILIIGGYISFISFLGFIAFGVGLIVTTILFSVWYSVVIVVILFDDNSFGALGKTKSIVSGNFMSTFIILLAIGAIQFIIGIIINLVAGSFFDDFTSETFLLVTTVGSSIALPLTGISIFYLYLDLNWRRDNKSRYVIPQGAYTPQSQQYKPSNQQRSLPGSAAGYQPPSSFKKSTTNQEPTLPQTDKSSEKFCGSCGAPALNKDDKFCNSCGAKYNV